MTHEHEMSAVQIDLYQVSILQACSLLVFRMNQKAGSPSKFSNFELFLDLKIWALSVISLARRIWTGNYR